MTLLRPRLRGLVFKLALFYVLLSLPTLLLVESVLLVHEFRHFMDGVASGSLDRATELGARDLAEHMPPPGARTEDGARLRLWLDNWLLRLQQPRSGLTPDESYVLMELADAPLAAAIYDVDGHELARSRADPHWSAQWPTPAEASAVAHTQATGAVRVADSDRHHVIRRVLAPVHDAAGAISGVLFVELRLPSPWQRLLRDSSFESPTIIGFLIVFGLASSIFLAGWVTRRLNRVADAANAWSRGDFSNHIGDRSNDELGSLSRLLDRMALDLKGLLRSRAQLATLAERERLARDLHDTVKQKAFALNLQLATARRLLGDVPGAERLDPAQRLIQQIQQELAQILDEANATDTDLPLAERVRTRANEWAHTSGISLACTLDDVPPLPAPVEASLLRIVDEALSNVLRHSGARRVELGLHREADRVRLSIADNGRGMNEATTTAGMGLRNMRERAQALPHGRYSLTASAGAGTRIEIGFRLLEHYPEGQP